MMPPGEDKLKTQPRGKQQKPGAKALWLRQPGHPPWSGWGPRLCVRGLHPVCFSL